MSTTPIKAIPYHVMWDAADIGRIREEFAHIADRGMTHVVLSPTWFRLQPRPHQVSRDVMQTLEACYDAAARVRLQAITAVLTTGYAGVRELPDWHHTPDVMGWLQGRTNAPLYQRGGTVMVNGVMRRLQLAHPYTTETYRTGQRELIRVVMGYFAGHPAARHWLLAPGWSYLADVPSSVATAWWHDITSMARRVHDGAVLMAQIDAPQLLGHALDVATIGCEVDMVVVDTAMPVLARRQHRPLLAPMQFLYGVVAGLAQRPTIIGMHPFGEAPQATWVKWRWYDHTLAIPVMPGIQLTSIWEAWVRYLQQTNVAGAMYPAGWHIGRDIDREARVQGLPGVSSAVRAECERMLRGWQQTGAGQMDIDGERYHYQPRQEMQRLWRAFAMEP